MKYIFQFLLLLLLPTKENHTNRHMAAPFHDDSLFFSEQHLA